MKKRLISLIFCVSLILSCFSGVYAAGAINTKNLHSCDAAVVMDLNSGELLYTLNENEKRYPASTTKIMTCIIALENLDFDNPIVVDDEASSLGGNTLNLKTGEKLNAKDLLYATMIESANDGACAIAKAVAGTVEDFAKMMNQKAAELGCTGTNFVNPHGLHDDNHYTTAHDLALIAEYGMKNETFRDIVGTISYTVPATNKSKERTVETTNWLLNDTQDDHKIYVKGQAEKRYCKYDGCIGIKTGMTRLAGNCIVAAAQRGNTQILAVCLHCNDTFERFADAIYLLDLGFSTVSTEQALYEGMSVGTVNVKKGSVKTVDAMLERSVLVSLKNGESKDLIESKTELVDEVAAPVSKGAILGTVSVYKGGELVGVYNAVATADVAKGGFLSVFGLDDAQAAKIVKVIKTILFILLAIIVAFVVWVIYEKRKIAKKKARKAARLKAKQERENLNHSDERLKK